MDYRINISTIFSLRFDPSARLIALKIKDSSGALLAVSTSLFIKTRSVMQFEFFQTLTETAMSGETDGHQRERERERGFCFSRLTSHSFYDARHSAAYHVTGHLAKLHARAYWRGAFQQISNVSASRARARFAVITQKAETFGSVRAAYNAKEQRLLLRRKLKDLELTPATLSCHFEHVMHLCTYATRYGSAVLSAHECASSFSSSSAFPCFSTTIPLLRAVDCGCTEGREGGFYGSLNSFERVRDDRER